MRIGLISGEFPPMQGGVGAFSERLAQALAVMGHELHVISKRDARPAPDGGGRVSVAQLRKPVQTEWGVLHPVARNWRWGDVGQIAEIALRYDLDVLNIQYQAAAFNMHSAAMNLAPWRLRSLAPTVVTFHDLRVPYLFPKAGRLRQVAVRLAAQKSQGLIATNAEDRQVLKKWATGDTRVAQIPIGSNIRVHDLEEPTVAEARRRLGVEDDAFLLGYFGFLNASKGADLLVRALAQLDANVHLVFIGGRTGSSDQKNNQRFAGSVEESARQLGIAQRVHWTGFLPDQELSTFLQAADVLAMPYRDGASLRRGTLMAALAHGRPVLSTEPLSHVAELVHGENLWLAARDEVVALARAINGLQQDEALRKKLALGAKRLAAEFTWETIASRTAAFFKELVV